MWRCEKDEPEGYGESEEEEKGYRDGNGEEKDEDEGEEEHKNDEERRREGEVTRTARIKGGTNEREVERERVEAGSGDGVSQRKLPWT